VIRKSYGTLFLMAFFLCAIVYAYWPSNKARFEEVARNIIDDEDTPSCR
ncbi:MAG: cytochrome c oxidase cbb3-type subunit 4, partial [Hyphomicrobiaceae bacterium]